MGALSQRFLFLFARKSVADTKAAQNEWDIGNALSLLCRVYPNFKKNIIGKKVCDFGCGLGYQSVAMAKKGARHVLGIDSNTNDIVQARQLVKDSGVAERVEFSEKIEARHQGCYDVVISQNSMEHFPDPGKTLEAMKALLNPDGGALLITFGPPWFAPYGSHMGFFIRLPWVNIIFPEKDVMAVRRRFRSDGAMRYEDVESGLNKMSIAKFERIANGCGMKILYKKYECVKGLNFLGTLPLMRELFINHVTCGLSVSEKSVFNFM